MNRPYGSRTASWPSKRGFGCAHRRGEIAVPGILSGLVHPCSEPASHGTSAQSQAGPTSPLDHRISTTPCQSALELDVQAGQSDVAHNLCNSLDPVVTT